MIEAARWEFLFLCRHAETHAGTLYCMGGGVNQLHVVGTDAPATLSVAAAFSVPHMLTPCRVGLSVDVVDADGRSVMDCTVHVLADVVRNESSEREPQLVVATLAIGNIRFGRYGRFSLESGLAVPQHETVRRSYPFTVMPAVAV